MPAYFHIRTKIVCTILCCMYGSYPFHKDSLEVYQYSIKGRNKVFEKRKSLRIFKFLFALSSLCSFDRRWSENRGEGKKDFIKATKAAERKKKLKYPQTFALFKKLIPSLLY